MELGRRIYSIVGLFLFVSLSCNDVKANSTTAAAGHTSSAHISTTAEAEAETTTKKITINTTTARSTTPKTNTTASHTTKISDRPLPNSMSTTTTSPKPLSSSTRHSSSSSRTTVENIPEVTSAITSTSEHITFPRLEPSTSTLSSTATVVAASNSNASIIIGVVVGVGGAIVVGVVILVLILYRRKHGLCPKQPPGPEQQSPTVPTIRPYLPHKPIPVIEFLDYVANHQANISAYKAEFESLPAGNKVGKSTSKAKDPRNQKLNRYVNILPYNDTLVPLSKGDQAGYINASFVDGYSQERAYIASQAPLAESVEDFWQMIWEHDCGKVIMVTNLLESGRPKCDKYWPNVNELEKYGPVKVEAIAERTYGDYILRTFRIEKQLPAKDKPRSLKRSKPEEYEELHETRLVYQFHFTTWPDQGVPSTCTALLKLYRHSIQEPLPDCRPGPVVIHCSAGVGRTGTMIALDLCLARAKDQGTVDIPRCIDTMRRQRMYMVQTVEQYIFIHHVLLEVLILDKVEIPCVQFHAAYQQLIEPTLPNRQSRIQLEFKVLEVLKPRFDESMFLAAQEHPEKNRLSTLLPADSFMPYILNEDQSHIYMNAVYVFGHPKAATDEDEEVSQYSYIATQSPTSNTIEDFWTMIKETGSSTIVMLNELEGVERYWPEDGRTMSFGPFSVTNMGEISSDDIRMTDLQIAVTKKVKVELENHTPPTDESHYANAGSQSGRYDTETFNIRHFRVLSWPDSMPKEATLISLYGEVIRCQERNPHRPVVVHCLYGADRCGVFCGIMNVLDTIKMECEVDVFNAVKLIRRTRAEFIPDLAQYKFLYDVAMEQIKSLDKADYANYRRETTAGTQNLNPRHLF